MRIDAQSMKEPKRKLAKLEELIPDAANGNLLARRIVDIAQTGETDPELLKQYAMSGFALRNTSTICAVISKSRPVSLAVGRRHDLPAY